VLFRSSIISYMKHTWPPDDSMVQIF